MKSFKTFLLETTLPKVSYIFRIYIGEMKDNTFNKAAFEEVVNAINPKMKISKIDDFKMVQTLEEKKLFINFYIECTDTTIMADRLKFEDYQKVMKDKLWDRLTSVLAIDESDISSYVDNCIIDNEITFPVDFKMVTMHNKTPCTLHNIDKFLKCEFLLLANIHNITGNVLGLLKIPRITNLSTTDSIKKAIWFPIMKEYIKSKGNVWKCQDELQDADMDEYADF